MGTAIADLKALGILLAVLIGLFSTTGQAVAQVSLGESGDLSSSLHPVEGRPLVPEIAFKDRNGRHWGFVDFRGRPVVVTFWATWCPVCALEIPRLDQLKAELGPLGVEVIALSIDRADLSVIEEFYARRGIRHLKIHTDSEAILASVMGIAGVPTSFVIDSDGRMVGFAEGGVDWSSPDAQTLIRTLLE